MESIIQEIQLNQFQWLYCICCKHRAIVLIGFKESDIVQYILVGNKVYFVLLFKFHTLYEFRFSDWLICSVFNFNKNVNTLIARELSGFTYTRLLTMHLKFSIPHEAASCGIEISRSLLVNSCR